MTKPMRARTVKRKVLAAHRRAARRGRGRSILDFAGEHSLRLDMSPAGYSVSDTRLRHVMAAVERSGVAPYLERRLRQHPGKPCSYRPDILAVGVILSVMNGWTLELTDVTKALAGIHPLTRMELGLHDDDGFFVGYRSVDHQFNRLADALTAGWVDDDGTRCDTQWLIDAIINASVPDDAAALEAVSMDGLALQTWGKMRWPGSFEDDTVAAVTADADDEAYDDRAEFAAPEALVTDEDAPAPKPAKSKKGKTKAAAPKKSEPAWPHSLDDRRPVPTADPDARLGKRTVTESQPTKNYAGYELHLASQVRTAQWEGDPEHITLGDAVPNYVRGMRLTRASEYRAAAGAELVTALKEMHPSLNEALADRGYTQLKAENFHDVVRALGIKLVMDYKTTTLRHAKPYEVATGRRNLKTSTRPTQRVWRTAGGLFHQFMPEEYLDNPALPWKSASERATIEAYYNRRAAYAYRIHSAAGDQLRLVCPGCAGRLRPIDPLVAAATDKLDMPALDVPDGVSTCCVQKVITTTPADRGKHWQEIPYGTTAWARSYGRRALVENTNSVLRNGLARLSRGFFRVFGKDKVSLLVGLALAALNLKMAEKTRRRDEVDVVDHDWDDDSDEADTSVGEADEDVVTPPPRGPAPPGEIGDEPTTE
ncbi:MAG: hypothetical protein B7C54_05755 [Acidimicrobiales bacterium mtb01]|nr:hypothetical protein [Actinomycetota bacterium]TEX46701.1 MAG: hypothetical protein B7C54_05755 [Acidimicrobiales bacterium mtb01]